MTAATLAEPKTKAGRNTAAGKRSESLGNVHRVNADHWRKWGITARTVFNDLYSHMRENQRGYRHPQQLPVSHKHWLTTAWNAAWQAADAVQHALTDPTQGRAKSTPATPGLDYPGNP